MIVTRFCCVASFLFFHCVNEHIEQAYQICGTGHVLWVELNTGENTSNKI